jgi:hypothetical protein
MKQLFRKYDTNKDRRLDHGELRGMLTRLSGRLGTASCGGSARNSVTGPTAQACSPRLPTMGPRQRWRTLLSCCVWQTKKRRCAITNLHAPSCARAQQLCTGMKCFVAISLSPYRMEKSRLANWAAPSRRGSCCACFIYLQWPS